MEAKYEDVLGAKFVTQGFALIGAKETKMCISWDIPVDQIMGVVARCGGRKIVQSLR
jgi:hypothetical protein